jgi:adenine-specific DNA-methyltransferase
MSGTARSRDNARPASLESHPSPEVGPVPAAQEPHEPRQTSELGAIFTRRWVAELVLDLTGYTVDAAPHTMTILEPACGHGAFVEVIVERLVASCSAHDVDLATTYDSFVAMDLDPHAVTASRRVARNVLARHGVAPGLARRLASRWIRQGDFLIEADSLEPVRWVVGNPPYVRIEDVSGAAMAAYRHKWKTMSGRADVYVGFFEAALGLLQPGGELGFICADRWMRNRYGAGLRRLVEDQYSMEVCLVMHAVDAFEDQVAAYPAITVIASKAQADALVVDAATEFDPSAALRLVKARDRGPAPVVVDPTFRASWLSTWPKNAASWPAGAPERLAVIATLEARLPTLEESGARVSVGVATGADEVYVIDDPDLVEPGLAVPTLAARETASGGIDWKNRFLVNPWDEDGLIGLGRYPKFDAYLKANEKRLRDRYVARNNPDRWWRTIDRVAAGAPQRPKLLIPDLKDRIFPIYDQGKFMPLHSLYYVTSDRWDLAVLGGILMSDIANMFVEAYSVKMANGYMRVSAQYLRLVRVPDPDSITKRNAADLRKAFWSRDELAASRAARSAYGLTQVGFPVTSTS